MKITMLAAIFLMAAPLISQAAENQHKHTDTDTTTERSENSATERAERSDPENTRINKRDRDEAVTPMDQSNSQADLDITQAIRKSIMDQDFSMDAKNIKIITRNGEVTLRGPVNSAAEKSKIAEIAKTVPGIKTVNNQLEVK